MFKVDLEDYYDIKQQSVTPKKVYQITAKIFMIS